MLTPADSEPFKLHLDRLKDTHSELTKLALTAPPSDLTILNLGLSRLKDTLKCFDLISYSSDDAE